MLYNYDADKSLTDAQRALKWSLYCESKLEEEENIIIVLKSLLRDLEG